MSDTITFYHNPQSRAQMAHWMLEEVGAPYDTVLIDFEKGENKTPEFLAINPMGKLPTIVHRDVPVTETAAIIGYLADVFPEAGLAPSPTAPERGTYLRWLVFGASCFEPAVLDKMLKRPDAPAAATGYGSYENTLDALETALTPGPYILGDRFSAADVYIGSELNWAMMFGAPELKDRPVFVDYVKRLTERPAYKRASADQK